LSSFCPFTSFATSGSGISPKSCGFVFFKQKY